MNAPPGRGAGARGGRPRSVATRIVFSYVVVLSIFCAASGWSVWTLRSAVREAELLRTAYLPLALGVRDLLSNQDTWNTQLNHVTTAGNPADIRVWFETALSIGRPKKLAEVRAATARAFSDETRESEVLQGELFAELGRIERLMRADERGVRALFDALGRDDVEAARRERDSLVKSGLAVGRAVSGLEARITGHVDALVDVARARERTALGLLVSIGILTVLVGALMALYARRVVAPISLVTARAEAVARGDLSARPVIDSGDEIGQLSATFESMVEAISRAREQLLAAERLAAIGKMAAHVTHEVRNPLSSIALNVDLLEEELDEKADEARGLLRAIGREVQRLSGLSDQYLSMARRKVPELEECDVGPLVTGAVEFVRREVERAQIHLDVEVPSGLPWVEADQGQIRQALYNLIRNAREAMAEGGALSVRVHAEEDVVRIVVEDEGPGVPAPQVEQLFDPFFTTKDHGTGLGLAITREIVVAHGGRLVYEARVPRGSRFVIELPVAGRGDPPPASAEEA